MPMSIGHIRRVLCFLFLLLFIENTTSIVCYQCISNLMVQNWSRYKLPRLGYDLQGDTECEETENVTNVVHCEGICLLINVTTVYKGKLRNMGVLRDCQKYYKHPQELETERVFQSRDVTLNRRSTVNVSFCFCQGDYCNGMARESSSGSVLPFSKRAQPKKNKSTGIGSVFSGFVLFGIVTVAVGIF